MTKDVKSVCVRCVGIFRKTSFTTESDVPCMCNMINNNNVST